jgi:UDP-N-acetylmuramyl pentapeptide phosphotransferase/UDP-N-acetylglucosamine-1-phosphate transferase
MAFLKHLLPILISFGVSGMLAAWMVYGRWAYRVTDQPNERSLHNKPVPRIGGLAIMGGICAGGLIGAGQNAIGWLVLPILLALLSLGDDIYKLPVSVRLPIHVVIALLGAVLFGQGELGVMQWLFVAAAIVWMTNLFNFMDGSDGLAGGMAAIGFLFLGLEAWTSGNTQFAIMNWTIVSAAFAFLLFNFHPARIFMGDSGSIPIGFLAAAHGFYGFKDGLWPAWFPILVFSPFIVDATITLLKRLLRGDKIWHAHREHYYQRVILLGHGHRKTALLEYAVMIAAGLSALWGVGQADMLQAILLGVWGLCYLVLARVIDRRWCESKK